jgi:hypothetical protein
LFVGRKDLDLDEKDEDGKTDEYFARGEECYRIYLFVGRKDLDLDEKDEDGKTAADCHRDRMIWCLFICL